MADQKADQKTTTAAAQAPAAKKKTFTADEWKKLPFADKKTAQANSNVELSAEQLDDIETEEDVLYHRDMLKKQTMQRMPRVLQGIASVANLSTHNPNEAQQTAILKALDEAVAKVRDAFAGKSATGFQLPE